MKIPKLKKKEEDDEMEEYVLISKSNQIFDKFFKKKADYTNNNIFKAVLYALGGKEEIKEESYLITDKFFRTEKDYTQVNIQNAILYALNPNSFDKNKIIYIM